MVSITPTILTTLLFINTLVIEREIVPSHQMSHNLAHPLIGTPCHLVSTAKGNQEYNLQAILDLTSQLLIN